MLGHVVLVAFVAVVFLARPGPEPGRRVMWGSYVRLTATLGFPVNIDSALFMRLAAEPGQLLQARNPRQSRPVYVLGAALLGRALTPFIGPAGHLRNVPKEPFYVAYVCINFLILIAALEVFHHVLPHPDRWPIGGTLLATFLLSNQIVKAAVWMPHTQMFTILGPLACTPCVGPT